MICVILPKHSELSAFAPDTAVSNLELKEQALLFSQSFTWRGNAMPPRTWSQRLKQVRWVQLLSARMCTESQATSILEKYTASLEAIPVSHSVPQDSVKERMTRDTFGRLYENMPKQLDLFGCSSRTSEDTSLWDSTKFTETYEKMVTQLNLDYSARQKSAHHTKDAGSSSWRTPTVSCAEGGLLTEKQAVEMGSMVKLSFQVVDDAKNWATPRACDYKKNDRKDEARWTLTEQARNWPTPVVSDVNTPTLKLRKDGKRRDDMVSRAVLDGQQDEDSPNTSGKNREQLNPNWSEQLMGIPVGWTGLEW